MIPTRIRKKKSGYHVSVHLCIGTNHGLISMSIYTVKYKVSVRRLVVKLGKYFRRNCQITNKFVKKLQIIFFLSFYKFNKIFY